MIRCPFNNFSKCDGSCPFSMPDFTSCRIATALVALEGQAKGAHAQLVTVNAHLADMRTASAAAEPAKSDGGRTPIKRGHRSRYPEETYIVFKERHSKYPGQPEANLVLSEEHTAQVLDAIGETCSFVVNEADKTIVLMSGNSRKLVCSSSNKQRRTVCMQSVGQRLADVFPGHRHVYFDLEAFSGLAVLRPNGKVD